MGGAAAAIIAMKQIVEAFRAARATSVNSARTLADLRLDDSRLLGGLRRQGAILEASPGTFYLDEPAYAAMMARRRVVAITLAITLAFVWFGIAWLRGRL